MDKEIYNAVSQRADGACEVCRRSGNLELHHILRRKVPATIDNSIMLCPNCHRGRYGIHGMDGHKLDLKLKMQVQKIYLENGLAENEIRTLMGGRIYD